MIRSLSHLILTAALVALSVGCVQPGLVEHQQLLRADDLLEQGASPSLGDGVRITYLGTTGFLFESEVGSVLVDPYFSRFDRLALRVLGLPIDRDPERIAEYLTALPTGIEYILVTHGHFDHLFDVPEVADRTGATVLLSRTSYFQAAAAGLPENQMEVLSPGGTFGQGDLRITAYLSDHSPQLLGLHWYEGYRIQHPSSLRRVWNWKSGGVYTFLIEFGGKKVFFSAGNENELPPDCSVSVDLAVIGVPGKQSRTLFPRLVDCVDPKVIHPTHQDDFGRPLSEGFHYHAKADMEAVYRSWLAMGKPGDLIMLDYFRPWTLR